jgi:hypothetical protein
MMNGKAFSLLAFTLIISTHSAGACAQQAHLSATAQEIRLAFDDRFAVNSALHLARWYAYMGRPHPSKTDRDWQHKLQLAAKEAMQCVNSALPRYISDLNLQNALPSVDENIAKSKVVNLIVQGLYGPGNDTQAIRTFEQQMSQWQAPQSVGHAKGSDEVACFQKRPLPHLQWLIEHAADPELARQDAQALMEYPERTN